MAETTRRATAHRLLSARLRLIRAVVVVALALCGVAAVLGKVGPLQGVSGVALFGGLSAALSQAERLLKPLDRRLRRREREERNRKENMKRLLATGTPIRVRDANPYQLGVRRSRLAENRWRDRRPPYVSRSADHELRELLRRRQQFILVRGLSRAGKSRTAMEAILSEEADLRDHALLAPIRFDIKTSTLARLVDGLRAPDLGKSPTVLWLDDLHRYLDAGALTPSLMAQWGSAAIQLILVGTIRSEEYNRLRFASWRRSQARETEVLEQARLVLEQATVVDLPTRLSAPHVAEAHRLYPGHDWATTDFGRALVMAPALVEKLTTTSPTDAALVHAAVDWERAGLTRPISRAELMELWQVMRQDPHHSPQPVPEASIAWATAAIEDSETALLYAIEDGYKADDYIVAHREAQQHRLDPATWCWLAEHLAPDDAYAVGLAAFTRWEHKHALAAWRRAAGSADPLVAAESLLWVGIALSMPGRPGEAIGAHRVADFEEAIAAYDHVVELFADASEPALQQAVAKALVNKGITLVQLNRPEEAIAACDHVAELFAAAPAPALREEVAKALVYKGITLVRLDRPEEAIAACDHVVELFADASEPALQQAVAKALAIRRLVLERGSTSPSRRSSDR